MPWGLFFIVLRKFYSSNLKGSGLKNPPNPFPGKDVSVEKQKFAGLGRWITEVTIEVHRGSARNRCSLREAAWVVSEKKAFEGVPNESIYPAEIM